MISCILIVIADNACYRHITVLSCTVYIHFCLPQFACPCVQFIACFPVDSCSLHYPELSCIYSSPGSFSCNQANLQRSRSLLPSVNSIPSYAQDFTPRLFTPLLQSYYSSNTLIGYESGLTPASTSSAPTNSHNSARYRSSCPCSKLPCLARISSLPSPLTPLLLKPHGLHLLLKFRTYFFSPPKIIHYGVLQPRLESN